MNKQAIQFMLSQNKHRISEVEGLIEYFREEKRFADEAGETSDEYEAHEALKLLRKDLKQYVAAQKMLKKLMKS